MAIIICISENYYQAWKPVTERAGGLVLGLSNFHACFFCGNRKGVLISDRDKERAARKELHPKGQP